VLDARSRGYELIEKEHAAAVADRERKLKTTKAELADQMAAEKIMLEQQTAEARSAIAAEADSIAERIASNILKV